MIQLCLISKDIQTYEPTFECGGSGGTHLTQVFFDGIHDFFLPLGQ